MKTFLTLLFTALLYCGWFLLLDLVFRHTLSVGTDLLTMGLLILGIPLCFGAVQFAVRRVERSFRK